jgi:hypothetical protein
MIEFYGHEFVNSLLMLREYQHNLVGRMAIEGQAAVLSAPDRKYLFFLVMQMETACAAVGMAHAVLQAGILRVRVSPDTSPCNYAVADSEIHSLLSHIQKELGKQRFTLIPPDRHEFFESEDLFRLGTPAPFPSATQDIHDAGNAFAAGLYNATIFHLMRAAEAGLRVLAWDRRVILKHKGKPSKLPYDLATWDKILDGLEDAEEEIEGFKKTKAREDQLAFYHGAMVELRAFKNLFRNRIMHKRENYDVHKATSAMEHVGSFMRTLATRLSESQRTPKVWTNKWLGL